MSDWIVTIPRTTAWSDYRREIDMVASGAAVMNYRVRAFPRDMVVGDRLFVVWDGRVRGWMKIVALIDRDVPWRCSTTGRIWPEGKYIQRAGPFHEVDGPLCQGFRGIRRYVQDGPR